MASSVAHGGAGDGQHQRKTLAGDVVAVARLHPRRRPSRSKLDGTHPLACAHYVWVSNPTPLPAPSPRNPTANVPVAASLAVWHGGTPDCRYQPWCCCCCCLEPHYMLPDDCKVAESAGNGRLQTKNGANMVVAVGVGAAAAAYCNTGAQLSSGFGMHTCSLDDWRRKLQPPNQK